MTATAPPRPPGVEPTLPWPRPAIAPEIEAEIEREITSAPKPSTPPRRWRAVLYAWIFQRTAAAAAMAHLDHLEGLAREYHAAVELADRVGAYAKIADERLAAALRRPGLVSSSEPRAEIAEASRWHRREDFAQRRIMMAIADLVIAAEQRRPR